jgi:hypothetical protein
MLFEARSMCHGLLQRGEALRFLRRASDVAFMVAPFAVVTAIACASPETLEAGQAPTREQQNRSRGETNARTEPPQPTSPARVVPDGPIAVVNQPDPEQQERDARQTTQASLDNVIQFATLVFAGLAAYGALGAYRENRRSANAAEAQIALLKQQIADSKTEAAEQRTVALSALEQTRLSADAAKRSADAQIDQLRLLYAPFVDLRNPRADTLAVSGFHLTENEHSARLLFDHSDSQATNQPIYLRITWEIANLGSSPIRFDGMTSQVKTKHAAMWQQSERVGRTVGAGDVFEHVAQRIELDGDDVRRFYEGGLIVGTQLIAEIHNPIDGQQIYRTFRRPVLFGYRRPPQIVQNTSTLQDWPPAQGDTE